MTALADLERKNANVAHLFQQVLEEEVGPVRTSTADLEKASGETKQYIERLEADVRKQEAEIKALKIAMNRPGGLIGFDDEKVKKQARKAAMNKACKKGWGTLTPDERKLVVRDDEAGIESGTKIGHGQDAEYKALYGADLTGGGFLTVPEYVDELIEAVVQISDMHSMVNVRTTSNPYIKIPKRTQTASASRVVEQATRSETQNPKFGMVQVFPYESYALSLISRTDLDDSELDLGSFIMAEFAEQFAKLEGNEIINGTGAGDNECLGFLNDPNITGVAYSGSGNGVGYTTSASSGAIAYKDLVTQVHSLKPAYRKGASWVWTTETLGYIRGLTDTTGRPLLGPMAGDLPNQILGYPYFEMVDMPQIAASAFAVAFGNWKRAYTLVIRKQVSIQVLQERYADQNAVGYMGYYRFGGNTTLSEAIRAMKVHA